MVGAAVPREAALFLAWIDDAVDESVRSWAAQRAAPTLLIETQPVRAFTKADGERLRPLRRGSSRLPLRHPTSVGMAQAMSGDLWPGPQQVDTRWNPAPSAGSPAGLRTTTRMTLSAGV
jgi:hypothetical protein